MSQTTRRARLLALPAAAALVLLPAASASAAAAPRLDATDPLAPLASLTSVLPGGLPTGVMTGLPAGTASGLPSGPTSPAPSLPGAGVPVTGGTAPVPTGAPGSTSSAGGSTSGGSPGTQTGATPSASVGGGAAGVAKGCLSAGPHNGGGLVVLGTDLLARLAQQIPQVQQFAVDCKTADGAAVDADLVAATVCLRLDPTASNPLHATVKVLGSNVIGQLEKAGLPLQRLIVPCAAAAAHSTSAGAAHAPTARQSQAAAPVRAGLQPSAASRLPFTGASVLGPTTLGAGLLTLGTFLVRAGRRRSGIAIGRRPGTYR